MKQIISFCLLLCSTHLFSQTNPGAITPGTLNVGGGSITAGNSFSYDWSIGESTLIETYVSQDNGIASMGKESWSLTSGILQPFDNRNIIFNHLIPTWTSQEIRLFPVPTPNTIFIDFRSVTTGKIIIQLLSSDGKMQGTLEFDHVNGSSIHSWDLSNKAPGTYMFRILLTNGLGAILKQGTFPIEKIN